ncbi:uncharacterized protein DUF4229 [Kineococcus xinjiangensis]|uniref:Uncharacterized protein DUF4229 n=1 Tax=Kineococcus xinjiangensis TaxID=512762 RepID=A0A2S6IH50_9ACTN|nr:DUF4229 domain-containing protein [Kineococcus xinjiangensis]PPK93517.1 uncharacterized protein DUF4229 [Kineococcus xinjiangensis]
MASPQKPPHGVPAGGVSPYLKYTVLRLGVFVLALVVLTWAGARGWLALGLAAVVSVLLSLVLLRRQREEMALALQRRIDARTAAGPKPTSFGRAADADADAEDAEAGGDAQR